MVLLTVVSLLVGDWILIGESAEKRRALAVSTAIRNVPLAFLIANGSFPDTIVAPVVLIFSVINMFLSVVYGRLRGRQKA
jgi:predicted Na+-dependent transporter